MEKQKQKDTGQGPISKKVLSLLQKASERKVVDLAEWKNSKTCAENMNNTIISAEKLSKLDPYNRMGVILIHIESSYAFTFGVSFDMGIIFLKTENIAGRSEVLAPLRSWTFWMLF